MANEVASGSVAGSGSKIWSVKVVVKVWKEGGYEVEFRVGDRDITVNRWVDGCKVQTTHLERSSDEIREIAEYLASVIDC